MSCNLLLSATTNYQDVVSAIIDQTHEITQLDVFETTHENVSESSYEIPESWPVSIGNAWPRYKVSHVCQT